jgi:hypothetical protein
MLGDGPEQFRIVVKKDGEVIHDIPIHDPFLHSKTVIGISRWDLFKAMFKKQFEIKISMTVSATEGAQRAIMMLDVAQLEASTKEILEDRAIWRHPAENYHGDGYLTNDAVQSGLK